MSDRFTKTNPGCYHRLLEYLSEKTGISERKEITITHPMLLRNKSGKKLLYKSYNITVVDKQGNKHPYETAAGKRYDIAGITAAHFLVNVFRKPEEFGVPLKPAGNYKDWEGDGYYNCSLVEVDGYYFAPNLSCTCL